MMENNKQTSIDWFFEQLVLNKIIIWNQTTYNVKYKYEIFLEQAREMYQDEIEAAIIKNCATESTSAASSYSDGYKEGYKRALDYITDTIKNKIEIKEKIVNSVFLESGTTSTAFLCTQFIAEDRITTSLPNCIKCGKPLYQHPLISNT